MKSQNDNLKNVGYAIHSYGECLHFSPFVTDVSKLFSGKPETFSDAGQAADGQQFDHLPRIEAEMLEIYIS